MKARPSDAEAFVAELNTAAGFLSERQDFLHVYATRSVSGHGWDVVLRIDGTYSDEATAKDAAIGMREWMERLTDVATDDRVWWDGAPWRKRQEVVS